MLLTAGCMLAFAACKGGGSTERAIAADSVLESKVEETLKGMTLDEKVGQMLQLTLECIGRVDRSGKFVFDDAAMDSVFGKYKVGSILNVPGVVPDPQQWREIIGHIQEVSLKETGLPCLYGLDQNHGTTYSNGGTLFPQNINIAATFNRELARKAAAITAYETRAGSCPWTFCPTMDLGRDQRWSRLWEDFGEDCYLSAEIGRSAVLGFQGDDPNHIGPDNIAACLKHFMGYGVPHTGKDRTPAYISPQELREKHFAPYLESFRAGALSVMINSASVNGTPVHASHELLTEWIKEDLGWDGLIVTDWSDINNLYQREKVAADKKDAIRLAINAGIDMSMDPYSWDFCVLLKQLVEEGKVPMSRIDDAVRRVLRMKYRLGLFDNPLQDPKDYPKFGSKEHADVATDAAAESMVLLKNIDGILPLKQGVRILVTGPNANQMRCLNGGWSYTWQGNNSEMYTERYNTIYEALANRFGQDRVTCVQGVTYNERGSFEDENAPEFDKAVVAARNADVIVACVGENSYCETPGNLNDLNLSENQQELVKRLAATGKPVVLVLNEGRPRLIGKIEPLVKAVVNVMIPGNYGGDALAELLAGDRNFSGRLPYTYPREINSIANYDYKVSEEVGTMSGVYNYDAKVSLQWPFGFGMSYTTFRYSNLKVSSKEFTADDELVFTVDVTNTGTVAGKEVVALYSSDLLASLVPDNKRLRQFEKISLQPGETKSVSLKIKGQDLAFVGADAHWILEKGEFLMKVGTESLTVNCTSDYRWETPNRN